MHRLDRYLNQDSEVPIIIVAQRVINDLRNGRGVSDAADIFQPRFSLVKTNRIVGSLANLSIG